MTKLNIGKKRRVILMSICLAETVNMLQQLVGELENWGYKKRIWGFIANLLNITHLILVSGLRHICHILETSNKPDQTFAGICNYFRRPALWMIPLFFSLPRPFQITGTHFLSARCLFFWFLVNPQLLYFPPRAFLVVERWWEDREVFGEAMRQK